VEARGKGRGHAGQGEGAEELTEHWGDGEAVERARPDGVRWCRCGCDGRQRRRRFPAASRSGGDGGGVDQPMMRGSGEGSSPVVVAAPSPVTSVTDFGGEVVDTRSLEVEREEECDLGWSDAGSGGNSMGAVSCGSRGNGEKGGCLAPTRTQGGGGRGGAGQRTTWRGGGGGPAPAMTRAGRRWWSA
jgi:hypothetical protein